MAFPVLYEDDCLVIIRKPAGMHVHPTALSPGEPAVLQGLRDQVGGFIYPVHRLDRPTSGVLVFTKDRENAAKLGQAFMGRQVCKLYLALVRGWFPAALEADSPRADETGAAARPAHTSLIALEHHELPGHLGRHATIRTSLVLAQPHSGRRHQIRRHLARSTHPILGDTAWGDRHHNHYFLQHYQLPHLQLFSVGIGFHHPQQGRWLSVVDLPAGESARLIQTMQTGLVVRLADATLLRQRLAEAPIS